MAKRLISFILILAVILSALTLTVFAAGTPTPFNMLKNPSFEEEAGDKPTGWETWAFKPEASEFKLEKSGGHTGKNFMTIISKSENDARIKQAINVEEGVTYKLSCWVKTENIDSGGVGATIGIEGRGEASEGIKDTNGEWKQLVFYIVMGPRIKSLVITYGLGAYGSVNSGKVSFDDVSVEQVFNPPVGATASLILAPADENQPANNQPATGANNTAGTGVKRLGLTRGMWIAIAIACAVGLVLLFVLPKKKEDNSDESGAEDDVEDDADQDLEDGDESEGNSPKDGEDDTLKDDPDENKDN